MSVLFGLLNKEDSQRVPLRSIKNRVTVQGFTADVTATLEYSNGEENPIETIFVFPLDEQAAVCGFQATIDGRAIVAEVQEKQKARDTYDDAISSGQSAFLMEESDESSDIFQIFVGNLPPQKSATVELRFVSELEVLNGGPVVFELPTVLNPRYSPEDGSSPSLISTLPVVPASVDSPYSFDFELTVNSASEITEITSPSNYLSVQLGANKSRAKVRLAEAHKFDKDVVVHIMTSEPFQPHALVEQGANPSESEACSEGDFLEKPVVMLNFLPHFEASGSPWTGEFVFIVDRSGSMSGSRIKSAAETLVLFLKSLPDGCYFNIIGFGSSFTKLFDQSKLYNDETLKVACESCEGLDADLGGTEILAPLQWVFSKPTIKGYPRQVFLLTDGEVDNTEQVIAVVRQNAATARCFTFGVGHGASTALVKGVARAGKGTAEFVKPGERMQKKVIKTLKHALQPVLNDVTVNWQLAADWSVQQAPASLPPVYLGDRLVVYGVLDAANAKQTPLQGSARLSYTLEKNAIEHTISFDVQDAVNEGQGVSSTLHRLAAKCWIREKQDSEEADEQLTASIVSISKASNVVSKHTAFVAVDTDSREPVSGPLQHRPVPLMEAGLFAYCGRSQSPSLKCYGLLSDDEPTYRKKSKGFGFGSLFGARPKSSGRSSRKNKAKAMSQPQMPVDDLALKCGLADLQLDKSEQKKSKGLGSFFGARRKKKRATGISRPQMAMNDAALRCDLAETQLDDESESELEMTLALAAPVARKATARTPVEPPGGTCAQSERQDIVLKLITLQKASGSWEFCDQLASVCGLASSALLDSSPSSVPRDTQAGKDLWATALALALLAGKYWDRKDEWEMITDKGKGWLRSNSPKGVKCEDLMQAAAKALGVELHDSA